MNPKLLFILFFSLLSFFYTSSYGQRQYIIDSLNQLLESSKGEEKLEILFTLSWSYKFSNPQQSYDYGVQAYSLSKEIKDTKSEATSLNRMCAAKFQSGDLNEALEIALKAVDICKTNNYNKILATTLRHIGSIYEAQGNNSGAMKYYYNSLGLSDSFGIPLLKARSAKKVAALYLQLKKYRPAKLYLDYSLEVFKENQYVRGIHQIYILYGDYYYCQNLPDSARLNYNLALDNLEKLTDKLGYAITKTKIAKVDEFEGKFNTAIDGYNNALDTFTVIGNKKQIVATYISLAKVFSKIDNSEKTLYYAKLALAKAILLNFSNEEKEANQILYVLYKKNNSLKLAIEYLENYLFLMDSLTNSTESWRVDQMQKSYELEIQMKENALHSATIANQTLTIKNERILTKYLIATIVIVCMLVILIWYSLKHSRKVNKQLLIANKEKNQAISLISHDLKSPFNKIKGLIHILELQSEKKDPSFKDILSKVTTVTHEGLTLVQNLVDIKTLKSGAYLIKLNQFDLNDFIMKRVKSFEQLALSKNIVLNFEPSKDNSDVISDINSVARIFDNILSNAIKFSPHGEAITIDFSVVKKSFSFSISDNGKGVAQEEIDQIFNQHKTGKALPTGNETSNGLGLAIVSSLVNKLNGSIKCISSVTSGATFIVSLPSNKK